MKAFARESLNLPVRIGDPQQMEGLIDRVSAPAFATSVGLVHWGVNQTEEQALQLTHATKRPHRRVTNPVIGVGSWLRRALLPERVE